MHLEVGCKEADVDLAGSVEPIEASAESVERSPATSPTQYRGKERLWIRKSPGLGDPPLVATDQGRVTSLRLVRREPGSDTVSAGRHVDGDPDPGERR